MAFGFWLLAFGFWLLAFSFWLLAFSYRSELFGQVPIIFRVTYNNKTSVFG
jgi:hypothetical protein